jgi:hypothetical protein
LGARPVLAFCGEDDQNLPAKESAVPRVTTAESGVVRWRQSQEAAMRKSDRAMQARILRLRSKKRCSAQDACVVDEARKGNSCPLAVCFGIAGSNSQFNWESMRQAVTLIRVAATLHAIPCYAALGYRKTAGFATGGASRAQDCSISR